MFRIETQIEIAAPPHEVWSELIDFRAYSQWNPFIRNIEGSAARDQRLTVEVSPPGGRAMTFRPTVLAADSPRELRWLGKLWIRGLFDGEHSFQLQPIAGNRTRLLHTEVFRGLMVPLLWKQLQGPTSRGFEMMNQALKSRVESRKSAPGRSR